MSSAILSPLLGGRWNDYLDSQAADGIDHVCNLAKLEVAIPFDINWTIRRAEADFLQQHLLQVFERDKFRTDMDPLSLY